MVNDGVKNKRIPWSKREEGVMPCFNVVSVIMVLLVSQSQWYSSGPINGSLFSVIQLS